MPVRGPTKDDLDKIPLWKPLLVMIGVFLSISFLIITIITGG